MKKLLLTVCAAALFSFAAVAQEKETESNQYRETEEQVTDSVSTDIQEGVNDVERNAEEAGDEIQQESQNLRNDAEQAGDEMEEDLNRAGEKIEQRTEEAGESLEKTGNEIEQEMEGTDEDQDESTTETDQPGATTAPENGMTETAGDDESRMEASGETAAAPQVEVVEGKEGPQNEVVYKYQDEFFYVDRNNQKIVKAKESDLQEAKHDVIINDGGSEDRPEDKKKK